MGAVIQLLHNPVCALEILHLEDVGLNNDSIMCLRDVIANNSRLRELQLSGNLDVTTDGWVNFLAFPNNAKLEKLVLGYNDNINDEALDVFTMSLMNNRTLINLHLDEFPNVTTAGWTAFSSVVRNPNSFLEKLFLTPLVWSADEPRGYNADDANNVAISFADALTNNKRLRELKIYLCQLDTFFRFGAYQ
jgi:hypothetical protein